MLDPATLATPIRGADLDRAQRLAAALGGVTDLITAAGDLASVRAENLSTLLSVLVEPLQAELEALANRADGGPLKPASTQSQPA